MSNDGSDHLRIWYHGTNAEAAEAILDEGFAPGTYFAAHLEDALGYGGQHVFSVVFAAEKKNRNERDAWQRCNTETIPPADIVAYKVYGDITTVFHNDELGDKVFQSALARDHAEDAADAEAGEEEAK